MYEPRSNYTFLYIPTSDRYHSCPICVGAYLFFVIVMPEMLLNLVVVTEMQAAADGALPGPWSAQETTASVARLNRGAIIRII